MLNRILNAFGKKSLPQAKSVITTDIHSHLLPGIDDGVESYEESIEIIRGFYELGYTRLVTTPHIMQDYYKNEPDHIRELTAILQSRVNDAEIPVSVDAAAEYYLDESLMEKLENHEELLTFGDNFLLFETSFINKPIYLEEFIFKTMSQGYVPVMAHPERYAYIHNEYEFLGNLIGRGMLAQINANSLAGYYSREVRKMSRRIINDGFVNFIGSDCHSMKHLEVLRSVAADPYLLKATGQKLLNDRC